MRRILGTGGVGATVVVACWRLFASLAREYRRLAASGVLEQRLAARRLGRIERAVMRERQRLPIRVPVIVDPERFTHSHSSVQVGARPVGRGGADLDDLDLLEAAMRRGRRATTTPVLVVPEVIAVSPLVIEGAASRTDDFAWLEGESSDHSRTGVPVLAPVLLVVGLMGSFVPLVRPLGDASPWIALGSVVLVVLGWWRARA